VTVLSLRLALAATLGIIGGSPDAADPAVVSFTVGGYPACSGTLISENVVLSAGHCANALGAGVTYEVHFGPDARKPEKRVNVDAQRAHPNFTAEGAPFDLALFHLREPVGDVTPLELDTASPTDADLGAPLRHVGYGVEAESGGETGTRRDATWPLDRLDADFLYSGGAGAQTCLGDSGGPALLTRGGVERVVAVVSDGPDCHSTGWDQRVDRGADWIASTLQEWAIAPPKQGCSAAPGIPMMLLALGLFRRRQNCGRARSCEDASHVHAQSSSGGPRCDRRLEPHRWVAAR
jgi:V8-like Glu-specific endopeptidase